MEENKRLSKQSKFALFCIYTVLVFWAGAYAVKKGPVIFKCAAQCVEDVSLVPGVQQ